jgi:hypothetical protein
MYHSLKCQFVDFDTKSPLRRLTPKPDFRGGAEIEVIWGSRNLKGAHYFSRLLSLINIVTESITLDLWIFFVFDKPSISLQSVNLPPGGAS